MRMLVRTCRPRIGEEQMSSSQMHRTSKNSMDVDDRILGWVVFSWAINSVSEKPSVQYLQCGDLYSISLCIKFAETEDFRISSA